MLVMVANVMRELGIMHLVIGSKSYKIAFGMVMQALRRIEGLHVQVGETQCNMVFMIIDTNNYDVLMGLTFFY